MNRAIPSPGSMIDLLLIWVVRELNIRSDDIIAAAEGIYHTVKKRFEKGQGVIKNEKIRVVLWFPPMAFFTYLFKWMEHEFGAVIVADFIGHVSTFHIDTDTNETIVEGLAKTSMHLAMGRQCRGPIELFTNDLHKFIEDYSPDCMIFSGHNGCKHGWASVKIVQDICKANNLPTLYMSLDIMDKRHLNEEGIKKEITDFFRSNGWA
jgi:2-hydroxyglutaryl-CoA dehydratase D-component